MKKLLSVIIAMLMVISMGITGFAEESGVKVVLNGKNIEFTDAAPVEKDGRIMVPFTTIFESMGATVKYEDKTSIATVESKEIRIKENSNTVEILNNGKSEIVKIDVPAYVEKNSKRLYVPVSAISIAFGYDVYWEDTTKSVNVIDSEKLIKEIDSKYTIFNKMMAYEKVDMNKVYSSTMDGKLDVSVEKELFGTEKDMTLATKSNIEALSKGFNMNIKGKIEIDTEKSTITDYMGEAEKDIANVPFEFIMNADEGKMFVTAPIITGDEDNTWYQITMDPNTAMLLEQLKTSIYGKSEMTIGQLVYQTAWGMKDYLPMMDMDVYSYVNQLDKTYNLILADDLFKKSTEGSTNIYTAQMNKTQLIARAIKVFGLESSSDEIKNVIKDMEKIDYKMVLKEKNGKVENTEISFDFLVKVAEETLKVNMLVKGNEKNSNITINAEMGKSKIVFDLKTLLKESNKSLKTAPPKDATIIYMDETVIEDIANGNKVEVIGGADGPTGIILEEKAE